MQLVRNEFLGDEQWAILLAQLQAHKGTYIGSTNKCRRFVSAIFWVVRHGAQWKHIPGEFGRANSIYRRYVRWESSGIWRYLHRQVSGAPELQAMLHQVDSVAPPSSRSKRSQSLHYRLSWSPVCELCLNSVKVAEVPERDPA